MFGLVALQLLLLLVFPLRGDSVPHYFDAAANRILSGEIPYIDFYAVPLPASLYVHVPAAALGRWLGVNGVSIWLAQTWLQMVASVALCWHLGKAAFGREAPTSLQLIPALSIAGLSWFAFMTTSYGQREHVFAIFAAPWLLARFCSWEGRSFRALPAFAFGALVGIATAIKPYFFLVIVGVECYWLLRCRRIRPLLRAEVCGLLGAIALYLGLIVANAEVFQGVLEIIEHSLAFQHLREPSRQDEVNRASFIIAMSIGALACFASVLARRSAFRLLGAFGSFTILGGAIIVLQSGSHDYRYLILFLGAALCAGQLFSFVTQRLHWEAARRYAGPAVYLFVLLYSCFATFRAWGELDYVQIKTPEDLRALVEPITEPGDRVLFLTGRLSFVYPWFGLEGLVQTSGMIDAWILPFDEDSPAVEKTLALYARTTRRDIEASPLLIIIDKQSAHKARVPEFMKRYGLIESLQSRYSLAGGTSRFEVYEFVGDPPPRADSFDFGDKFTLYSWDFDVSGACGTLDLRTWWRPGESPDLEAYTLHVDLVGVETGTALVESYDRIGAADVYGGRSSLLDAQQVELPCDQAAESVMLLLSLEDMGVAGGRLLPVQDSRGADYGNYVYLGEFSLDASQN